MNSIKVLCVTALLSACTVGNDDSPPIPAPEGIVTSPRHGAARIASDITVEGLFTAAGVAVTVERWDATSHAWVSAGTGATSTTGVSDGDRMLYPFRLSVAASDVWPAGGLLSLRARVADFALASLDGEAETQ